MLMDVWRASVGRSVVDHHHPLELIALPLLPRAQRSASLSLSPTTKNTASLAWPFPSLFLPLPLGLAFLTPW